MANAIAAPKDASYDKWEAEEDMRTLIRASEIHKDPKRMARARRAAKEKLTEMQQIKELASGAK